MNLHINISRNWYVLYMLEMYIWAIKVIPFVFILFYIYLHNSLVFNSLVSIEFVFSYLAIISVIWGLWTEVSLFQIFDFFFSFLQISYSYSQEECKIFVNSSISRLSISCCRGVRMALCSYILWLFRIRFVLLSYLLIIALHCFGMRFNYSSLMSS